MDRYLVVQGAADHCELSRAYLDYLRTVDARKRGLSGPPYKVKYGRIVYSVDQLTTWNEKRLAKKVREV